MGKEFDINNPKDMKALEKMKKKSAKRVNTKVLSKTQKENIACSVLFLVSGIVCLIFIRSTFWRIFTGVLLIATAISCIMTAFEKQFKKQSSTMFVSNDFPNILACGVNNNINYNAKTQELVITNIEKVISPVFNFSDIAELEILEDSDSKIKYSIAGAMIGDWAFGTLGAILGAKNMSTTKQLCKKLELVVYFKNIDFSNFTFVFVNKEVNKNSAEYKNAIILIKDCYGKLQAMMQTATNKK